MTAPPRRDGNPPQYGTGGRVRRRANQPQQGGAADPGSQPGRQPGPCPSAQRQRDRPQHRAQASGSPAMAGGLARYLLGEGPPTARAAATEEPADQQVRHARLASGPRIGQPPLEPVSRGRRHEPKTHPRTGLEFQLPSASRKGRSRMA